jgi:hypothetical protein
MTIPTGRDQRRWKPWYKRYWLIRGRRREDKQARLVVLATLLAIVPIVFVLASGSASTPVYLPIARNEPPPIDPTAEVLDLVNAARAQAGCGPLTRQPQLQQAAQDWSNHMGQDDVFAHRDLAQIATIYGYQFFYLGENIAAGSPNAQAVFTLWMNSAGHRANILNCNFQDIGIGMAYVNPDGGTLHYRYYWTQNFGQPSGSVMAAADAGAPPFLTPDGLIDMAYPPPE